MTTPNSMVRRMRALVVLSVCLAGAFGGAAAARETSVRAAQEVNATRADAIAAEALALLGEERFEQAQARITEALRLRVDRSSYHLINALAYHLMARQGKSSALDLAEQGYQMAIRFDRTNWQAYHFAGLLAIDASKYGEAARLLAEALSYQPRDKGILHALSYAAYRAGKADLAAGALNGLLSGGPPKSATQLRNAAMIMAAVGEQARAGEFVRMLSETGQTRLVADTQERVADWSALYKSPLLVAPLADAKALLMPEPEETTAPGTEHRMVVVDVVMIATEETLSTAQGVNLLRGLQLQFGQATQPAYGRGFSSIVDGTGAVTSSSTITRALGIPAITYTLNIVNAATQRNEILARPTLVARAGKTSTFFSGIELNAVATSGSLTGGNPVNIEKAIGVNLQIKPLFLADGRVSFDITAERTFLKAPSDDVNFTFRLETMKSKVEANVVMRFGETLILGGLSEKEAENARDGVPLLQEIPLLQYAFSRSTKRDFQKSLLILVTPRPPQYVYQPEKARLETEKGLPEEDRIPESLKARYADWFKPYPNWASVFHHMQANGLYREFR
ncbi:MAG: hypothetical protein RIS35_1537, partial [Pseudomonadota bacterium]